MHKNDIHWLSILGLYRRIRCSGGELARTLLAAWRRWLRDDAISLSAAVSYYLALSIFPLMLLLTGAVGLVLRYSKLGHDARQHILQIAAEHCSPSLESKIVHVLDQVQQQSLANGPLGFLTSLMAALGVFYQFERAFDKIWRIPPPLGGDCFSSMLYLLRRRISAFFLLAGIAAAIVGILLANLAVGMLSRWISGFALPAAVFISALDAVLTICLNGLAFAFLYYRLPKRPVPRSAALKSGFLISILWEASRLVLATFVIGVKYDTAYGAIGSFIGLLLWFYWGVALVLFGAEYVIVLTRCSRQQMNLFTPPADSAVLKAKAQAVLHLTAPIVAKIKKRAA